MPEVHRENQQDDEKGSTTSDTTARDIALCDLRKNDYNPRTTFDDEAMDELQESIDRHGLISSLLVRPLEEGDVYEVVAGERRLRALRKIHGSDSETEIPCLIDEMTDCEARVSAFVENHERVDLTPIEEAKFLGEMATVTYTTDSELGDKERTFAEYIPIAKDADCSIQLPSNSHSEVKRLTDQIGLEATSIRKRLALLALPDAGQIAVDTGTIGLEAAYRIASGLSELSAAEARREHMLGLIDGAKSGEMAIREIEERTEEIVTRYEREQAKAADRIEAAEAELTQQKRVLFAEVNSALSLYNEYAATEDEVDLLGYEDIKVGERWGRASSDC